MRFVLLGNCDGRFIIHQERVENTKQQRTLLEVWGSEIDSLKSAYESQHASSQIHYLYESPYGNGSDVRAAAIDSQADEQPCHRRSVTIAWLPHST
ncbi:hypothetical protein NHH03_00210 [Stieleria sp. TO1_6]|uniref:hypothetical protein n=1 Tax=Stieleria tagensis TaxID=2956795 RepID=UPI00209A8B96|nr:hypothetical protein [Stieleria tagensis]MCO8120142.1 hypothetical protein [Stieleria tagensis]